MRPAWPTPAGFEVRSFRLRRVTVPVLPRGMRPLRVLQVSDIHMVSGQRKKQRWLQSLAGLRPDFVINTGDNLSDPEGVPETLDALGPLMEFPGAYVFGSNDYYGPKLRNPPATSSSGPRAGTASTATRPPWASSTTRGKSCATPSTRPSWSRSVQFARPPQAGGHRDRPDRPGRPAHQA